MLLFRPKRNTTKHLNFSISGQYILQATQFKYVGLTKNEHHNWDLNFSQLRKKWSIMGLDLEDRKASRKSNKDNKFPHLKC